MNLTGFPVQQNVRKLTEHSNGAHSEEMKLCIKFYVGWHFKFTRRWRLKSYQSYAENGDADEPAVGKSMPLRQPENANFNQNDIFNADEIGLNSTGSSSR